MPSGTLEIDGRRFVILPREEYEQLKKAAAASDGVPSAAGPAEHSDLPALPPPLASGNYPALEYAQASIARDIMSARTKRGWSQQELARRAGIRRETLSRIETAKHVPTARVLAKIDRALGAA